MHEYLSASSLALDITIASSSNRNLSISSSKEIDRRLVGQSLPRQQPVQVALVEVAEWQKEFLAEWGDRLVEGHAELKSLTERRLYEPNESRLL